MNRKTPLALTHPNGEIEAVANLRLAGLVEQTEVKRWGRGGGATAILLLGKFVRVVVHAAGAGNTSKADETKKHSPQFKR